MLSLGDLLFRAGPGSWPALLLLVVLVALLLMNAQNARRALTAAPPDLLERVRDLIGERRFGALRSLCQEQAAPICDCLQVGLAGSGTPEPVELDRAATLHAWRALAQRYEWWPKTLIAFGVASGVAALPLLALQTAGLATEIANRFAEDWVEPPVGGALQGFVERAIVTANLAALFCGAAVVSGLVFLQLVRAARHGATARLVSGLAATSNAADDA